MDIKVTFTAKEHRDAFANRWKLDIPTDTETEIHVPWHLLQHAKADENSSVEQVSQETHSFIVQGEQADIAEVATIEKDMGDGWFLVSTNNGVGLSSAVTSIEAVDIPVEFLSNIISLGNNEVPESSVSGETIDPNEDDGQWPRIRTISRSRPLMPLYSTHDTNSVTTPELYIMDSGINFDHQEFDYPELEKENFFALDVFDGDYTDDLGHGTAVASMAVGKNLSIANHVKLVNVKIGGVVNGEHRLPSLLEIGEAIDAIVERAITDPTKTRVVNMSWGTVRSAWLDSKVNNLLQAGITVVTAAGNKGISVDDISPAGIPEVITVGSVDKYDIPSGFNNISPSDSGLETGAGLSLDIFAPGENVVVADGRHIDMYMFASGTSLSAPMVAGVACEIASLNANAILEPNLKNMVLNTSTEDALLFEDERFSDNQNRLLYFIAGDSNIVHKAHNAVSYLGTHEDNEPIVADLNSSISTEDFENVFPDIDFVYSIELDEDSLDYASFISCDSTTGVVTIQPPVDMTFQENEKLKMVKFVGKAESNQTTLKTNTIFFFDINPDYRESEDIESDVTLALTEVNSISFFAFWSFSLK